MYFIGKNFVAMFTQWENIRNIFFFFNSSDKRSACSVPTIFLLN